LVRQCTEVTDECSVAEISIFQTGTIGICLAVAGNFKASALLITAGIRDRTGVAVVAGGGVGQRSAAPQPVTSIIGARIVVVAENRLSGAFTRFAMVAYRTRITVHAFTFIQGAVGATVGSGTAILGAAIAIVTELQETAIFEGRLVRVAITIVVKAIARLVSSDGGIAFREPFRRADAFTFARSRFVLGSAGSPECKGDGLLSARTLPGVGHTLQRVDGVNCDRRQT